MSAKSDANTLRDEYEFTAEELEKGIRGKYAERYSQGVNLVRLDADVAAVFPDSESVNRALRSSATERVSLLSFSQVRQALEHPEIGMRRAIAARSSATSWHHLSRHSSW